MPDLFPRQFKLYYFYNVGAINRENDEIQYVDTEIVAFIHCIAALLRKAVAKIPAIRNEIYAKLIVNVDLRSIPVVSLFAM